MKSTVVQVTVDITKFPNSCEQWCASVSTQIPNTTKVHTLQLHHRPALKITTHMDLSCTHLYIWLFEKLLSNSEHNKPYLDMTSMLCHLYTSDDFRSTPFISVYIYSHQMCRFLDSRLHFVPFIY